ncbi:hypothetical protein Syun_003322 [Stephania yunnanensis]|uniref:Glycoside hydrolase family 31 TIM barrel domain-containing protein n=1 Tax=Stephania yunnanensis TaxID=152371 RepID=A0AAP0L3J8_9MAGN
MALWFLSLTANRLLTLALSISSVTAHCSLLFALWSLCAHRSAHHSLLIEDVLSLSHRSRADVSQLSLSLTEISLPNPKSLSSLRLWLRRGRWLCRRRLPKIGASEALSRRRPTPHPKPVGLSDEEIYQYCLNLKEHVPSRRSTRLPSRSEHGQKFSGTEITLCTYECINNLVAGFTCFLQKVQHASHVFGSVSRVVKGNRWMLCLEISYEHIMLCIHALLAITLPRGWHAVGGLLYKKTKITGHMAEMHLMFIWSSMLILKILVAVELVVDPINFSGTRCDNLFIVGEDIFFSSTESNIECLVSGFKDYVQKHGNTLDKQCQSCFLNRRYSLDFPVVRLIVPFLVKLDLYLITPTIYFIDDLLKLEQLYCDPDQRLVADCNLEILDIAAVADRRGHFAVLSSKNHFEVCLDRFPNPKALVNELHLNGFKAIWMFDPGIKHEEGYFVYDSGSKEDVWIQNVDGKPFVDGYEEYSEVEYSPAGCTGEYTIIECNLEQEGGDESLKLEGDIGGGLVLQRQISVPKNYPKLLFYRLGIIARNVGAGSGGFSRLVCLRVHPSFTLLHPTKVYVTFESINGSKHEIWPDFGEQSFEGDLRPNGEWMLVDRCLKLGLVNRFKIDEVYKCLIHWGTGTVNLELWSEQRPV